MKNFKNLLALLLTLVLVFTLAACGGDDAESSSAATSGSETGTESSDVSTEKLEVIKVGVVGENNEPWKDVAARFEEGEGIKVEIISFTDYNQPNEALASGDLDLNSFQHKIFLDNFNTETGNNLVPIGDTVLAPIGLYSNQITDVSEIKEGDRIAIPDDVTNYARSLFLLQTAGLIEVEGNPGEPITLDNVTANPLNLEIIPMNANQTARSLDDVVASAINSGMAVDAGFYPAEDSFFLEPVDDNSTPYVNIIVSREEDTENEWYLKLVKEYYQTDETAAVIDESSKGSQITAWDGLDQ